ncbi:cation-translocating P-type ATPase [Atopobacter sp. AH10]|uniref:cation-translocating P-type ATPase n=1 Tax=Atopobacter sp. AH10 TaxID=2315861 RepID=UPI000EF2473C|nr:cation-translocating P-type ATPase [Atopobacter sp. AH10]RLK64180.1 cation-translocating P-type ATPase [Atopobacter sp. AH10]
MEQSKQTDSTIISQDSTRYYTLTSEESLERLNGHIDGLNESEITSRRAKYGLNKLQEGKQRTLVEKFIDQFKDFMIGVLLAAAIVSAMVGEVSDAFIILIVVILNAVLGVFQETQAEEAINALRDMASPLAKVKRDGHTLSIKSEEIVPGDIVLLEAGDIVPADMRLIESNSLKIEEAALTGESVPVEKYCDVIDDADASLGDRLNMAYSSTNVTYGRGLGIVTRTGMSTEVGQIANMLNDSDEKKTPLQENQEKLGKSLTIAILIIAAIIFVTGVIRQGHILHMVLISISIAVAAIPEGLPAISTIILAIGTQNMAKRNALVRKLPAVETLGGTQIICSDKTGTLTMNQMTVEKVMYDNKIHDVKENISLEHPMIAAMSLANDTKQSKDGQLLGDPTETALVQFALDKGFDLKGALETSPRVGEVPFDSTRKMMSTIHDLGNGRYLVTAKGAPDLFLTHCSKILDKGEVRPLNSNDVQEINQHNHAMATQALRVLATGYKFISDLPSELTAETIEHDLVFAGLAGMIDPEREEAKASIRTAKDAGIRTIMITGDHKDTAAAIAKRLGILDAANEHGVLTGAELNQMSDEELKDQVAQYSVYARVSPEHKVRIVKAWQSHGKVVAMTGDGVNDAPSLKAADIGVGMGITGTEVSKGASDMVLADDNFQTIVFAVEEGRKVFANIQKAVQYLLSANLGEVMTMFVATMLSWSILEPVHILWINLVTDVFPAIALGMEPTEEGIMDQKPRGRSSNFLSNGVGLSIIYQGIIEGSLTLFMYWYVVHVKHEAIPVAETMAFATLGLIQLFHAFNVKSVFKSLITGKPFANKPFNLAILLSAFMHLIVIVTPGLRDFFDSTPLGATEWLEILFTAFSIVPIVELSKFIMRKTGIEAKEMGMKE